MNKLIYTIFVSLYLLIVLGHGREVTIAVVKDGPSSEEVLIGKIQTELERLTKGDPKINFKSVPNFDAAWDVSKTSFVIQNALQDREVDLILGIGALVTQTASKPDLVLSKPFVSTFVERADVAGITYEDDQTLKDNFNMMVIPQRTERDIRAFHQLKPFDELFIAYSAKEEVLLGDPRALLKKYEDTLDVSIKLMAVSDDISSSLSIIDAGAQAVLLTRLSHLTKSQREQLIDEINIRKIPSLL